MTTRKRIPKPIEGEALLEKIKSDEIRDLTRSDAAIACGYWRFNKDIKGKQYKQARVDRFNKAIATAATAIDFLSPARGRRGPRGPQKTLKVNAAECIILGKAYTRQFNLQTNDRVSILVDHKNNQYIVKPIPKDAPEETAITE